MEPLSLSWRHLSAAEPLLLVLGRELYLLVIRALSVRTSFDTCTSTGDVRQRPDIDSNLFGETTMRAFYCVSGMVAGNTICEGLDTLTLLLIGFAAYAVPATIEMVIDKARSA